MLVGQCITIPTQSTERDAAVTARWVHAQAATGLITGSIAETEDPESSTPRSSRLPESNSSVSDKVGSHITVKRPSTGGAYGTYSGRSNRMRSPSIIVPDRPLTGVKLEGDSTDSMYDKKVWISNRSSSRAQVVVEREKDSHGNNTLELCLNSIPVPLLLIGTSSQKDGKHNEAGGTAPDDVYCMSANEGQEEE